MLIYTGFRLASPKEFAHAYHIGKEQFALFVATMMITLATDLLIGVCGGLVLKVLPHWKNGAPLNSLFKAVIREQRTGDTMTLIVHESAIFSNYLGLKNRLDSLDPGDDTEGAVELPALRDGVEMRSRPHAGGRGRRIQSTPRR